MPKTPITTLAKTWASIYPHTDAIITDRNRAILTGPNTRDWVMSKEMEELCEMVSMNR